MMASLLMPALLTLAVLSALHARVVVNQAFVRGAGEGLLICANDTYEENALYLEIETTCDRIPIRADIYWNQQRIICLEIADFVIE